MNKFLYNAHHKTAQGSSLVANMGGVRICLVEIKRRKLKTKPHQTVVVLQKVVALQEQLRTQQNLLQKNLVLQDVRLSRNISLSLNKKIWLVFSHIFFATLTSFALK